MPTRNVFGHSCHTDHILSQNERELTGHPLKTAVRLPQTANRNTVNKSSEAEERRCLRLSRNTFSWKLLRAQLEMLINVQFD